MTLDATGLSIPSQADIEEAIKADIRSAIGPQVQLDGDSVTGRIITIFSAQLAQAYEQLLNQYDSTSPDRATGTQLDLVSALVLVTRDPGVPSFTGLTFTGAPTTIIPAGSIYRVPDGARFLTILEDVIPGGGSIDISVESEIAGAIEAPAGTITEQVTIIAGVTSVTNAEDAEVGRDIETDEALRQRRESSLVRPGGRTEGAIRAALLAVDTVTQALVLSNDTDATDSNGLPPHSYRSIVWPLQADDDPIWLVIWQTAPATIFSDGLIAGTITDSQGISQDVRYSLADEQELYLTINVTTDPQTYGGDDEVDAAVVEWGSALAIGDDVLVHEISAAISDEVTGILTLEVLVKVGSAPDPADDENITIALDEIATVDTANVLVVSS